MIALADLKAHLNPASDEDDALLTDKLAAASAWIAAHVDEDSIEEAAVQEATLQLAATFYEQREAIAPGELQVVPFTVWDLIEPYRVRSF